MSDVEVIDLGLQFTGSSATIFPEGLTLHYGGPSPWTGEVDRSSPEIFMSTANHNRCPTITRAWHEYHLSKGWFGLAYNDTVCPHGVIYKGRGPGYRSGANGDNEGNQVSPAICYIGGDGDPLTDPAKLAYKTCESRYSVPLIWPHQHWTSTSCPGDPILAWIRAGFPIVSTPPLVIRKKAKMISTTKTIDGRIVEFMARPEDGRIVHRWQNDPSSGPWSDWALLVNSDGVEAITPGAFDSVEAQTNSDGRLEIFAWHSAFLAVFATYQVSPGGVWVDWYRF